MSITAQSRRWGPGRLGWAALLLGFAFGGFFDGILLHQILQWHHLLSGLDGSAIQDLRVQILADGLFHALMYVVAMFGLWRLWRARAQLGAAGAGRALIAWGPIGFGIWHIVDAILSHWLLGNHRLRMDVDNPLLWDLLWFSVFGVAIVLLGAWLLRAEFSGPRPRDGRLAASLLALLIVVAAPVAARPPGDATSVMVLFKPGTSREAAFAAVAAVDGRPVWHDSSAALWAVAQAADRAACRGDAAAGRASRDVPRTAGRRQLRPEGRRGQDAGLRPGDERDFRR